VHHVLKEFKQAYNSVKKEITYNILIEFYIPMLLVRLIKMCVNEAYSRVCLGKYLFYTYSIRNDLEKEMLYRHSFSSFL